MHSRLLITVAALICVAANRLEAQTAPKPAPVVDSTPRLVPLTDTTETEADDEGTPRGLQFGVAAGALHYAEGRDEQALGVIIRWAPLRWLAFSTTPTGVRVHQPALGTAVSDVSQSGLADLPVEATVMHSFDVAFSPTLSAALGATLPVGDSARGFGSGRPGFSTNLGLGFSPTEKIWVHLGAGRTLSGLTAQSSFSGGSSWGDVSAGLSLTERVSVSGGYSSDLGTVDPAFGRSSSIEGGFAVSVHGATTLHVNASHGVSGIAPTWSLGLGFGTAFPYLNHLDAASAIDQLRQTFAGGSHGLGGGTGSGSGSGSGNGLGRGRGRP